MQHTKQVWAIQHIGYETLGSFEPVLESRGFDVRYFCSRTVDYKALFADDPELLVVLGGPMSVYDTERHPWVHDEKNFVTDRIEAEKPLFGICFGAQMIARALGADVYAGPQGKEIGWSPITVNQDGLKTPLRHLNGELTNMLHWHGDTFDLPDGAILLASSDHYKKQAYSYDDYIFCLQCHPEVTQDKLRLWYASAIQDVLEVNKTVAQLRSDEEKFLTRLTQQSQLFMNEWLDEQNL